MDARDLLPDQHDALRWTGPRADFAAWSERLGTPALHQRASKLAAVRAARRAI